MIERVMARVARRQALSVDEAEDFTSWARLRLLEGGSATLAKFEGKSTLETFLRVVLLNLFRDYRIAKWGKWRPSAVARRLGPAAIRLETLIFRDGLSSREAIAMVSSQLGSSTPAAEIERLAERLPVRSRPRFEREEALYEVPALAGAGDSAVIARELEPKVRKTQEALRAALGRLPPQDRLVLKLRFQEGLKVVEIARALGVAAKNLYPRLERCMALLRRALEEEGVQAADVRMLLDWEDLDLAVDYQLEGIDDVAEQPEQVEQVPEKEPTQGRENHSADRPRNGRMSV
jgi:RNA polymerase sigma factor (sigma-70 family)